MSLEEIEKSFKCDKTIFSMFYHINLQWEQDENVIAILNKSLGSSKSRLKGLEILSANIRSLPTEVIIKNAFIWLNVCVGQHHKSLREVKLSVIAEIIEQAHEEQDFTKKLLSDYMTKILELCLSSQVNTYEVGAALSILNVCMKRYGSWFGSHKSKVEDFLLNFLFSQSINLVEKAAEAFLHLQQVGGAGIDGINHRSNFSSSFHKLCITTQKLFDKLFENETEVEQYDLTSDEGYAFPDSLNDTPKIVICLENCFTFIKTMMLKRFPEIKEIKPVEVLNMILRGTSLHLCITGSEKKSFKDIQLSTSVNAIQIKLMELLNIFIIWFQGNSLPFSYTISKILMDCLLRSQKCKCFKINSIYQEAAYRVLNCWLGVSRCAFQKNFQTKLIDCILEDITPTKNEIKLLGNNDKNSAAKKKKIHIRDSIISGSNSSTRLLSNSQIFQEHKICCAALTTLKCLLRSSWLRVNTEKLQVLYTTLIGSTIEVITKKEVHPYTNLSCQENLFDALVAFYEESTLSILPNINIALDILTKGRNSKNIKISSACERGLSYLEILCQPICPSLYTSENSSWKQLDNTEKIFNNTSEELPQIDAVSDDQNGMDDVINGENNGLEESDINNTDDVEVNNENAVESFTETVVEEDQQIREFNKEPSIQILDVKVLKPSLSSEVTECTSEIATLNIQTENINNAEEVVDEMETQDTELTEDTTSIPLEDTNNDTDLQIKREDSDEPPPKMVKLEVMSEELDDEFVDQVKEY